MSHFDPHDGANTKYSTNWDETGYKAFLIIEQSSLQSCMACSVSSRGYPWRLSGVWTTFSGKVKAQKSSRRGKKMTTFETWQYIFLFFSSFCWFPTRVWTFTPQHVILQQAHRAVTCQKMSHKMLPHHYLKYYLSRSKEQSTSLFWLQYIA